MVTTNKTHTQNMIAFPKTQNKMGFLLLTCFLCFVVVVFNLSYWYKTFSNRNFEIQHLTS